ncbi:MULTISPECIES: hypothetical protein [unclassified Kribbella]|uniref:hypothetical protein n=1 Tax=unclassified Kribbella TaxID=2644121 RepID=UPI00301976AA
MAGRSRAIAMMSTAVLGVGLIPATASATPSASTANCVVSTGSVTAGGDHRSQLVISTSPPTVRPPTIGAPNLYADGLARLSSSFQVQDDGYGGYRANGYVVLGDSLYGTGYTVMDGVLHGGLGPRIGGGWSTFTALEEAEYQGPTDPGVTRTNMYALRNDGVLFRWTVDRGVWRNKVSAPGFAAVKSMVLISKTKTYDTFLANTRGGALYTIHIPTTSPMKPVVKLVRRSTWQGFEAMLGQMCGRYGTVLLGIDKDTKTGYLYAVGHANGLATVIQGLGKVPASFGDPVYFRWKDWGAPLFGE